MSSTMNMSLKGIQSKQIKSPINSWDQKEDKEDQPSTIIVKTSIKDHRSSIFQSLKVKVDAVSHIYMSKNLHK